MDAHAWTGIRSIVHVNEKGGSFGGTEEYIASFTRLLTPFGIQSHLVYGLRHGTIPAELRSHQLEGLDHRHGHPTVAARLLATVQAIQPDIVYIHNIFDPDIVAALDIPNRSYQILWYVHDHFLSCLTELRARISIPNIVCHQPLSPACLDAIAAGDCTKRHPDTDFSTADLSSRLQLLQSVQHADAILVVSEFMREMLTINCPEAEEAIYVIPRQVRAELVTDRTSATPNIVFSGRITPEKGLRWLIEALLDVQTSATIAFQIAGVIENAAYWADCLQVIQQLEHHNPHIRTEYLGHLSYEAMDQLYAQADIVVFPSLWGEPLGVVAAEGMLNGAAVVAADVGGIRTWVIPEQTGLLVPPNDRAALSAALRTLLGNPTLRQRLADAGRTLIQTQFTAQTHLEAFATILQSGP